MTAGEFKIFVGFYYAVVPGEILPLDGKSFAKLADSAIVFVYLLYEGRLLDRLRLENATSVLN